MNNASGSPTGAALVPRWNGRAAGSDPGARAGRSGAGLPATGIGRIPRSSEGGAAGTASGRAQLRAGAPGAASSGSGSRGRVSRAVSAACGAQLAEEGGWRSAGRSPAGNPARPAAPRGMGWNEPQEDRPELGRTPACQMCVTE